MQADQHLKPLHTNQNNFPYFCDSNLQPWLLNSQKKLIYIGTN